MQVGIIGRNARRTKYELDWLWLGLAVLSDIGMYIGGGYGNRERIPGYSQ